MKSLIKQLLRENLLSEGEILPYKQASRNDDGTDLSSIDYNFIANGIRYSVHIGRDGKNRFGEFEASFGIPHQKHSADRTSLDLKHLNNVLETVTAIIDEAVQKYKLRTIKIEGARDEYDADRFKDDTLRTKLYLRQISKHYPKEAITKSLDWIYVDMTKVYPKLFSDLVKMDTLLELLAQISDEYDFTEDLNNNMVNGENDDVFYIGADYLVNSKLGQFNVEISVHAPMKEYSIEWGIDDTNENGFKSFDNFKSLVNYMKETFLTPEQTNKGGKMLNAITNKLEGLNYTVKPLKANIHRDLIKRYDVPEDMVYLKYFEDNGQFDIFFTFDNHDYFIAHFEGYDYLLEILDEGTSKVKTSKKFENFDDLLRYI